MKTREAAFAALFAKVSAAFAWNNTPSRRLVMFNNSPKEQRPAFYQYEGGNDQYKWTASPYPARMVECELYIYLDASDPSVVGASAMNNIKDAIDLALAPDPVTGKCNLGGTCEWARIDGKVESVPGDIDGDGLIVLPVKITLP